MKYWRKQATLRNLEEGKKHQGRRFKFLWNRNDVGASNLLKFLLNKI